MQKNRVYFPEQKGKPKMELLCFCITDSIGKVNLNTLKNTSASSLQAFPMQESYWHYQKILYWYTEDERNHTARNTTTRETAKAQSFTVPLRCMSWKRKIFQSGNGQVHETEA